MNRATTSLFACTLALSLAACGGPPPAESEAEGDLTSAAYQDADELISNSGDLDRWRSLKAQLETDFNQVCGDTFCEGDYSNLRPLSLRCSVILKTSALKSCKYVFAGSYEDVNPSTGTVKVTARTFSCAFTTTASPKGLMDALLAPGATPALRRPLPGSTKSIYDSLVGCL